MDSRLVGWGRAVKSRQRGLVRWPVLWLFTDIGRMPNLLRVVRALPRGLCGVVFRHDGVGGRAELAREVWRECRERRLPMVVAGAEVGFAGPGRHWRSGRASGRVTPRALQTASAHGRADLVRARRNGADLVFLSPAFATASHPGERGLGAVRWAGMAQGGMAQGGMAQGRMAKGGGGLAVLALGGVDGMTARRLPRWGGGAGAIGALSFPSA